MDAICSRCGESHAVATYPSINVAADPDLKARVRDGSLFVWECPHCGARNLLKYETLYHDPAEKLMVWLLPGDAEPPRAVADAVKELDSYTLRLVREVGDLVEKVNIHACGLDDVLVEMCKYVTRLEMADQQKRPEIQDAPLKFFKMDGWASMYTKTPGESSGAIRKSVPNPASRVWTRPGWDSISADPYLIIYRIRTFTQRFSLALRPRVLGSSTVRISPLLL